jgi:SAM-dependent methyltransferase
MFGPSKLASRMLRGLEGVEIGGAAHNAFGLRTINVDKDNSFWVEHHRNKYGIEPMKIDVVVESGDKLPFADNSFDFVISSHVIEHFYDPITALKEWVRVARRYVFLIVPHRDRTFDKGRPLTRTQELFDRHEGRINDPNRHEDRHWSVWQPSNFHNLVKRLGWEIAAAQDPDDKVGNGFTVVIRVPSSR